MLVAYSTSRSRTRVTVHYALTAPATITLRVQSAHGKAVTVAHAKGRTGLNTIRWNRRLGGHRVVAGRYRLTITASANRHTVTRKTTVKL